MKSTIKKWNESQPGRKSAMRIMVVPGFYCGILVAILGAVAVLSGNPDGVSLVVAGFAFSGSCLAGKSIQKRKE